MKRLHIFLGTLLWAFCAPTLPAQWSTLEGCRLLSNDFNDGDSFHVEHEGKEYIFRLYFVDAPETDLSFPERVAEQGKHFGISPEEAISLGKKAKKATERALSGRFTVITRFQGAKGRSGLPRYFAFVETGDRKDLAAVLVANGLARVFGVKAISPEGTPASEQTVQYENLERRAKRQRLGAYRRSSSRERTELDTSIPQPEPSRPLQAPVHNDPPPLMIEDSNAERINQLTSEESLRNLLPKVEFKDGDYSEIPGWKPPAKTAVPDTGLISLNSATSDELQELPGVGPQLARAIVARRPFSSVADLRTVSGIGPKKYAELLPLVSP